MIQFDKDGVTLFYIDASGKKISHNWMEGNAYSDMLSIRTAQMMADLENSQSAANYKTVLANAQLNVNNGHELPAPAKPLQKTVSDTGVVGFTPFDPPLGDLIPASPIIMGNGSMFGAGAGPAAADKQSAVVFNMVSAMFRKMFPDA